MSLPTVALHESGPRISRIVQGFGSIMHEEISNSADLATYIHACLDEGITAFDLAAVYSGGLAETAFGEVLAHSPELREQMCILTKYGIEGGGPGYHCYNTSREAILRSVERSLTRMHIDHIDVLLMHRPDLLMNADEVAEALEDLHRSGKVLHVGVSNFLPSQIALLSSRLSLPLVTNEIPYNIMNMEMAENGTLDLCQQLRMAPLFYSPLAGGRLLGTPNDEQARRVRATLEEISRELDGAPLEQIAIAWVLKHPCMGAAILGCGRVDWMRRAAEGARTPITRDQWFRIWTASKGHEIP